MNQQIPNYIDCNQVQSNTEEDQSAIINAILADPEVMVLNLIYTAYHIKKAFFSKFPRVSYYYQ